MIDITPGNSPSESYKNSLTTYNNYHHKDSVDSPGDMTSSSHIPTHSAFGNDDFADPEGKKESCFSSYHVQTTFIQSSIANTSSQFVTLKQIMLLINMLIVSFLQVEFHSTTHRNLAKIFQESDNMMIFTLLIGRETLPGIV